MRKEHGIKLYGYGNDGAMAFYVCTKCGHIVSFIFYERAMKSKVTPEEATQQAIGAYCNHCSALIINKQWVKVTRRQRYIVPGP